MLAANSAIAIENLQCNPQKPEGAHESAQESAYGDGACQVARKREAQGGKDREPEYDVDPVHEKDLAEETRDARPLLLHAQHAGQGDIGNDDGEVYGASYPDRYDGELAFHRLPPGVGLTKKRLHGGLCNQILLQLLKPTDKKI